MSSAVLEPWTIAGSRQHAEELACRPDAPQPFRPAPYLPEDDAPSSAGEAEEGVLDWLATALAGEWADDQTMGQIAVDFGFSLVPGVDQVFDARDLAAHVYRLGWKGEHTKPMRWIQLVFTLAGMVPGVGSVIKSASKAAFKGAAAMAGKVDELLDISRRVGLGLPDASALARWLREHWGAVKAFGLHVWNRLLSRASEIVNKLPTLLSFLEDSIVDTFAKLAGVSATSLPQAFDEIGRMLDDGLDRAVQEAAPLEAGAALRTDALGRVSDEDQVFSELAEELGTKPARVLNNWTIPGDWKDAKPDAYKLIFGTETLPDINKPRNIQMTLGHIVEKVTGGTHSLDNLMPQLNAVNVKLAGIFARKRFHLKLPSGEKVRLLELNEKEIGGSLRDAFKRTKQGQLVFSPEEQRAMSSYMLFQVVGEFPEFERRLAELIQKIPNLVDEFD